MRHEQLTQKLEAATQLPRSARVFAYREIVDLALLVLPEFARAVQAHRERLTRQSEVHPYDTSAGDTFRQIFSEYPGLARAYGVAVRHPKPFGWREEGGSYLNGVL